MRDFVAGIAAIGLLLVAASLATTLHFLRRRRLSSLAAEHALGRTIVAELPISDEMTLFSEDHDRFYHGEHAIDKEGIVAVRLLINGAPIAEVIARRHAHRAAASRAMPGEERLGDPARPDPGTGTPAVVDEAFARDRWDVAIESATGAVLVECGAIREGISQELARTVFEAVRRDVDARNGITTRSRELPRGD
jgi:hypothetical protein